MNLNYGKMYPPGDGSAAQDYNVSTVTSNDDPDADVGFSFTNDEDPFEQLDETMGGAFTDVLGSTGNCNVLNL